MPQTLYATFANPAPGITEAAFRSWYEDVHRPDSFALGLFEAASRQRAHSPSEANCLTLWEAPYPDTKAALDKIRPAAAALREQGRIHPVLSLVFQQFLQRVPDAGRVAAGPVRTITTLSNDWSRPGAGQGFASWWEQAVGGDAPLDAHHSIHAYAAFDLEDPDAGKFLVVLESEADPVRVEEAWHGVGRTALTPFGAPTPVYPEPGIPERARGGGDPSPEALAALHVVHWEHESDATA